MTAPTSVIRLCVVVASLTAASAFAQNTTWNNSGTNWSSVGSWTSGVPDTNLEKGYFSSSGSPQNPNVDGNYTINGLTFSTTAFAYTFGGTGSLTIDANSASNVNTIQINGNQTFNVDVNTTNSGGSAAQRFVIGTSTGTMNFGAGKTLTVGTGGITLGTTGSSSSGEFNFYGNVSLGANAITQSSAAISVYFREGSSVSSSATAGIISNSAGNMYFETDNVNLGGSAQITMFGSLTFDAGVYLTKNNLNISENVRIANTASGFTRTVGVDIAGSGTATWSGDIDISQNSGSDIARTVKLTAGTSDRAIFSGNIISSSATVFTDSLVIDGGGTVVLSGTNNTFTSPVVVNAGTVLLANNAGTTSATGANSVTINGTLGGTGRIAPGTANGITVNSGAVVSPGDGGIESLEINLSSTTGTASFLSGSTFSFDLAAPGASDVLAFTGLTASSGDVAFNGNTVNFTNIGGLAAGLYTLFTFDQANAYTGTLNVGSGLGGFTGNFVYNADRIQLNVVPEPGTVALIVSGLGLIAFRLRRRA